MPRRVTVLRDDCDGGKRPHEVELRVWKATAKDGRSVTLETESWHMAREQARIALKTLDVELEEVENAEGVVLFTTVNGDPLPSRPATKEELARSAEIMEKHGPKPVPARLDADRKAKPKTVLTAPVMNGREGTNHAGPASFHVDRETGTKTPLGPAAPATTALERMKRRAGCK